MRLIKVNVLKEWVENWFTKNRFYHPYAKNNNIPITELYDILEQMPSAQPEITQEDVELYCRRRCLTLITNELFDEMKARWSAQPVIRCKDCKNFGGGTYCHERDGMWDENDFCSYAERKEQDDG